MRRPSPASLVTAGTLGIILCLAAVLAGWGNDYGLPHPTGRPDEENVVQHAFQMMASGNLARPVPKLGPFEIDHKSAA